MQPNHPVGRNLREFIFLKFSLGVYQIALSNVSFFLFSAKLHALLNSSHMTPQPPPTLGKPSVHSGSSWEINEESQTDDSRRSTPMQPPPAHQQARTPNMPFDLKYTVPGKTTIIPGTSSTLTPIDLSSGYDSIEQRATFVQIFIN